jgi:diguanylate cyclase (GGDEF)-like protein
MVGVISDVALLAHRLPRVTAGGTTLVTTVGHASRPVDVVDGDLPMASLERAFRSPDLTCVAVRPAGAGGMVGLISRRRYEAALSGRLGFGRALLSRGVAADLADWRALVVDPSASIVDVALAATDRPEETRDDAVLVRSAEWHAVTPSDLVLALTSLVAARSLHDPVTALANRTFLVHQLRDRCQRTRGTAHRVAVVRADVVGLAAVNAELGHEAGDRLLATVAAHALRNVPPGWDVGRTGADELTAIGTIPGPLGDDDAAAVLETTRVRLSGPVPVAAVHPDASATGGPVVTLRAGAVYSRPGGGSPDRLLAAVEAQLRALRRHSAGRLATAS